ncbi:MAG: hypothetical protein Q7U33_03930 [Methylotenera sp.]|uniref:hypothetical protein n=1 Tax=Methylotenera sp. TaxID=2051956 RepID=UPI0027185CC5|nr:hypothetical protein [Methylotenera sp.]MDO9150507.1 hypothetical protein [Methylotenera sp.]
MNIFIATSFEAKDLFNEYKSVLTELGHNIYDWTVNPSVRPYALNRNLVNKHTHENIDAITSSDCFILVTDSRSRSAFVEFGVAINSAIMTGTPKIFVIGDDISMYIYHSTVSYVSNLNEVIKWIKAQK